MIKEYLQKVTFYSSIAKELNYSSEMIFIIGNLYDFRGYLQEKCREEKMQFVLGNAYFTGIQSLKLREYKDYNFYSIDYKINPRVYEDQYSFSRLINDKGLNILLSKNS